MNHLTPMQALNNLKTVARNFQGNADQHEALAASYNLLVPIVMEHEKREKAEAEKANKNEAT